MGKHNTNQIIHFYQIRKVCESQLCILPYHWESDTKQNVNCWMYWVLLKELGFTGSPHTCMHIFVSKRFALHSSQGCISSIYDSVVGLSHRQSSQVKLIRVEIGQSRARVESSRVKQSGRAVIEWKENTLPLPASGKRWSMETKVWKRSTGSEKKSHLSVFSASMNQDCVL